MITQQIEELDAKIDTKAKELNRPFINDSERLGKTRELVKLFDEQNELLNIHIQNIKKTW